jgi:hypothetical protein
VSGCGDASGLWQVNQEVAVADDGGRPGGDTVIFRFDGDTVTMSLLALHPGPLRSDDGFYRLAAECRDDELWYRPPFGDWVQLATFEDGHFVDIGSGRKRIFARISDDDVAEWSRAILSPRARHDYGASRAD